MATTTGSHGGTRKGAGRPRGTLRAPDKERIVVMVDAAVAVAIDARAVACGQTRTEYVRAALVRLAGGK